MGWTAGAVLAVDATGGTASLRFTHNRHPLGAHSGVRSKSFHGMDTMAGQSEKKRILVIGQSTSLIEGVADLLQTVGYPVDSASALTKTGPMTPPVPPDLMIVDLSVAASDVYRHSEEMCQEPPWSEVPVLYVSFSGDDQIRELQRNRDTDAAHRFHFYAHPILGLQGLLETVKTCLG